MVIYIDVLIFTNTIIDYIIISLTEGILHINSSIKRIILASLIGGLSSIYIFFSNNIIILDLIIKLLTGATVFFIAFGRIKIKTFIYGFVVFLLQSFALNGLILFFQGVNNTIFLSKNFIGYINVSPILLIALSTIYYLVVKFINKISERKSNVDIVELIIELFDKKITLKAMVDSGHTLIDPLSDAQIFIIDSKRYNELINTEKDISNRKRVIPIQTVSDSGLLEGIRCDKGYIKTNSSILAHNKPVVLRSNQSFNGTYDAIISKSSIYN